MKWIFRLTTVLLLIGALGIPFFIDNKNGEPMLSLPSTDGLLSSNEDTPVAAAILPHTTKVFKWKDANGVWHYTDQAPSDKINVETVEIDSRTNVIQGLYHTDKNEEPDSATSIAAKMTPPDSDFLSMDRAMNVMKDAKLARKAMEQRNQQLQEIVGEKAP